LDEARVKACKGGFLCCQPQTTSSPDIIDLVQWKLECNPAAASIFPTTSAHAPFSGTFHFAIFIQDVYDIATAAEDLNDIME
jgi:hypothetical protein